MAWSFFICDTPNIGARVGRTGRGSGAVLPRPTACRQVPATCQAWLRGCHNRQLGVADTVLACAPTIIRLGAAPLCGLMCLLMAGCGSETSYPSTPLTGTIQVDGQPIGEGLFQIVPTKADQGRGVQAEIKEGRYVVEKAPLGPVVIILTARRKTGRMTHSSYSNASVPEMESLIPGRYASGIPLTVTDGMGTQDFRLERRERFDNRRVR